MRCTTFWLHVRGQKTGCAWRSGADRLHQALFDVPGIGAQPLQTGKARGTNMDFIAEVAPSKSERPRIVAANHLNAEPRT